MGEVLPKEGQREWMLLLAIEGFGCYVNAEPYQVYFTDCDYHYKELQGQCVKWNRLSCLIARAVQQAWKHWNNLLIILES